MTIYVTRHGQSLTNIDADIKAKNEGRRVVIDVKKNVLTEVGVQQALDYGQWVKDQNIEQIICSPYARTKQTAFCIASVLHNCAPIRYDRAFREIQWEIAGRFQRLEDSIPDFDTRQLEVDFKPLVDHKRNAYTLESQREVYERCIPAFLKTAHRYKNKNVLIVTHFFVVRAIQAFIHEGTSNAMLNYTPKNLERARFEYQDVLNAEAGGPYLAHVDTTTTSAAGSV